MEYIIVAFRSRTETIAFSGLLKNNGIKNEIVNTPKEAGVGCGLSVKIYENYLNAVRRAVRMLKKTSFSGIFSVKVVAGKRIVRSI